jgi:hypothetical protein
MPIPFNSWTIVGFVVTLCGAEVLRLGSFLLAALVYFLTESET